MKACTTAARREIAPHYTSIAQLRTGIPRNDKHSGEKFAPRPPPLTFTKRVAIIDAEAPADAHAANICEGPVCVCFPRGRSLHMSIYIFCCRACSFRCLSSTCLRERWLKTSTPDAEGVPRVPGATRTYSATNTDSTWHLSRQVARRMSHVDPCWCLRGPWQCQRRCVCFTAAVDGTWLNVFARAPVAARQATT